MLFGNTASVGIDLGTTGVRAAEVSWKGDKPALERWAAYDFESPITDWSAVDAAAVGREIRAVLDERGVRGTWAVHSISGEGVAPQYFNFPKLLPEDVADAVRIEVEAGLPFRVEDALISYVLFPDQRLHTPPPGAEPELSGGDYLYGAETQPLEAGAETAVAEGPKSRTHGLAIAADNRFVEARLAVLREAGLTAFCVETDSTACANAFLATGDLTEIDGTTAVLNIGERRSNLTLLHDGTVLVRDIPCGGAHVTQAICETLHVSPQEALQQKHTHWEKGPAGAKDLTARMDDILQTSMRDLIDRLRDSVQFWVGERLVPPIGRMLLCGGGSQIRDLPTMLSDLLSVPVERWAPIQQAASEEDTERLAWDGRLTVAFGLALRQFPRKGG
jgi:type IV pilus assembly protein PilM